VVVLEIMTSGSMEIMTSDSIGNHG